MSRNKRLDIGFDSAKRLLGEYRPFSFDEIKKISDIVKAGKGKVFSISDKIFEKVCYGERDGDPLAVVKVKPKAWDDLPKTKNPLYVVIESVEKPGNLGAILRTCDAAGVTGVIVCENKTDMYNPNVIRASLGTVFSVQVISSSNEAALDFLKEHDVSICAALPSAKQTYLKYDFNQPTAIVLGEEHHGLSDFWDKNCTAKLSIPMKGAADSLNVSASTAILVFEALRQRQAK
jgi:TrmH family RNA methyltransferase